MTSLSILFRDLSWLRILSEAPRLPPSERGSASRPVPGVSGTPQTPQSPRRPPGHMEQPAWGVPMGMGPGQWGHPWPQHPQHPTLPAAAVPGSTARQGAPGRPLPLPLSWLFILSNKGSGKGTWKELSSSAQEAALHTSNQKSTFCIS